MGFNSGFKGLMHFYRSGFYLLFPAQSSPIQLCGRNDNCAFAVKLLGAVYDIYSSHRICKTFGHYTHRRLVENVRDKWQWPVLNCCKIECCTLSQPQYNDRSCKIWPHIDCSCS